MFFRVFFQTQTACSDHVKKGFKVAFALLVVSQANNLATDGALAPWAPTGSTDLLELHQPPALDPKKNS